jgi:hypothetical protein
MFAAHTALSDEPRNAGGRSNGRRDGATRSAWQAGGGGPLRSPGA